MRVSWRGLLRLKPFDESADSARGAEIYGQKRILALMVVLSGILTFAALLAAFVATRFAVPLLGMAVSASAVTAGLEWQHGLKARALNQLFMVLVGVIGFTLIQQ